MKYVYNIFLHFLLVSAMLGFLVVLCAIVFQTHDFTERVRRSLALFAGAMVVIGAQASGVSFATFTTGSLGAARAASLAAHLVSLVIPALAGAGLGFWLVRLYKKSEDLGMRVVCFVGMLAIAAFAEVYASATHTKGVFLGAAAVPNLSFAVAVVLVYVFTVDTGASTSSKGRLGGLGGLGGLINRSKPDTDVAKDSPPVPRTAPRSAGTKSGARRDPFA